ncbi:MAG: hypothetical protein KC438_09425 [Thermomicrobiales bacterium]|nr:hypothetical protein [Thermomicrobiales bacterium]MCO5220857.1 hypothetical protein [Thermomicrobiales bacterium]
MSHRRLGAAMSLALLALAVAVGVAGFTRTHPTWWQAAVWLAVLGGAFPMILAVNSRIVPVFSRRDWVSQSLVDAMIALAIVGGWTVFFGRVRDRDLLVTAGSAVSLLAGLLFMYNISQLFRHSQPKRPAPPLPYPEQVVADRIATKFTRLSSIWLLVGLTVGFITSFYEPDRGRWELVWAHAMLVGFVLSMASGVTYHVLPRWTTRRWRSLTGLRIHWWVTVIALPLMVIALAIDSQLLFHMAGPFEAMVIVLWIANCLPFVHALPRLTGVGFGAALVALTCGVGLGMSFAVTPAQGALLRPVHAELNLFGWVALMICGVTYYLAPRFAGTPIRWPRLVPIQLAVTLLSLAAGIVLIWLRIEGHDTGSAVQLAHVGSAAGLALLAAIVAATFATPVRQPTGMIQITPKTQLH